MAAFYRIPKGRFFQSLRSNFFLLASLGALAIVLLGLFMANLGYSILLDVERQQLQESTTLVLAAIRLAPDQTKLQELVKFLKSDTRYRITVIAKDGTVLADTDADPRYMENHAERPEVHSALHGRTSFEIRYSHTLSQNMLYYAQAMEDQVLRVSMPLFSVSTLMTSFLQVLIAVLLGAVMVMAAVSWRMYRGIIIPVNRILTAAHAWETGGNASIFHVSRPLELAEISRSLRRMATELNKRIEESNLREQELLRLFEAIREPVLVLNQHQVIRSANAPALEFIKEIESASGSAGSIDEQSILNKHLLTFIRSSELANLIVESAEQGRSRSATIQLYGMVWRQFGAYAAALAPASNDGEQLFILVLYPERATENRLFEHS